jgi:hypothetical protein
MSPPVEAAEAVGPARRHRDGLWSEGAGEDLGPTGLHGSRAHRLEGVDDALPRPDPAQRLHQTGEGRVVLVGEVRADRAVVLLASTDADPHRESAAAEDVDRRELLGEQDGVVHGQHHHRAHDPNPLRDRRAGGERRDHLGVGEGDALTERDTRERALVDATDPLEEQIPIETRLHYREVHADLSP